MNKLGLHVSSYYQQSDKNANIHVITN